MTTSKGLTINAFNSPLTGEPDLPCGVGGLIYRVAAQERDEHVHELAAVGRLLELRRRELDMPALTLARKAAITDRDWYDLEHGLRMSNSIWVLRAVAKVLDLPADKLIEASGINGESDPVLRMAAVRCATLAKPPARLWPDEQEALTEFLGVLSAK